jgi:pimeloyl-ACP methyl ester carboxylesterase
MGKLVRDGVSLAYDEVGTGEPSMLFVHGWACDRTYFAPQVERFSRAHRTIAVDLRGHGKSDAPRQEYTMDGFADDLAWLCGELRVERPVVVGHSMGGVIGMVLAQRHPKLPAAVVMVDMPTAPLAGPPPPGDPRRQMMETLHGPEYREVARRFIDRMFLDTDDRQRRAWITERMTSTSRHVIASAIEQVWTCDLAAAASACTVPALYIQAATPRPELDRFMELCPQLVIGRTVGSGHFNMLEVPDQVNAMIERFLTTSVSTPRC